MSDWRRLLKGAFAFGTAPFASHPNDERRALEAIAHAIREGISKQEIEAEIRSYMTGKGVHPDFIIYQVKIFRIFFSKQYSIIRNCWILSAPNTGDYNFIALFSGRISLETILWHCMYIYESREFNQTTQFMRAKKKLWPTFRIDFHRFPGGGLWEGRARLGESPQYLLERADATLSRGLDPLSNINWKAKPIQDDPGETWDGMCVPSIFP